MTESPYQMFLLFSHDLTSQQRQDAARHWGVGRFVPLPPNLQVRWRQVPEDAASLQAFAAPFGVWLAAHAQPEDRVLVQGEPGLSYVMVGLCWELRLCPLHATTARVVEACPQAHGRVLRKQLFQHVRFRRYDRPSWLGGK